MTLAMTGEVPFFALTGFRQFLIGSPLRSIASLKNKLLPMLPRRFAKDQADHSPFS